MNYAHNNLRLKKLQFRLEKLFNLVNSAVKFVTPSKEEVELVIKQDLPKLPESV